MNFVIGLKQWFLPIVRIKFWLNYFQENLWWGMVRNMEAIDIAQEFL